MDGGLHPLDALGGPVETKKDMENKEWVSLDGNVEEAELSGEPVLEEGELSLIPREFLEESKELPTLVSEEGQYLLQKLQKLSIPQKLRLALFGNHAARSYLIHDKNKSVAQTVLRNPKLQENEVMGYAQMKNIAEDVLQGISRDKNWMKNYQIKVALVSNAKTPLGVAIRFLDHLHDRDLQGISRSRSVSSVLAKTAGRVLLKRKGAK